LIEKEEIRSKLSYFLENLKQWNGPGSKKLVLSALYQFVHAAEEY
jgi:hypothetical protein